MQIHGTTHAVRNLRTTSGLHQFTLHDLGAVFLKVGDHPVAHFLAALTQHELGRFGETLVIAEPVLLGTRRLPDALLVLQVLQVPDGHLDDFRFLNATAPLAHVLLGNQAGQIGEAGVHPVTPPLLYYSM